MTTQGSTGTSKGCEIMEQLLMEMFKESAITGAFIYLLHHFLGKNAKQMEAQSFTLADVGDTLSRVSLTLGDMRKEMSETNDNVILMDGRLRKLEERG